MSLFFVVAFTVALTSSPKTTLSIPPDPCFVLLFSSKCHSPYCLRVLDFVSTLSLPVDTYTLDLVFNPVLSLQVDRPPVLRMYAHGSSHDFRGVLNSTVLYRFVDRVIANQTQSQLVPLHDHDFEDFIDKHKSTFLFFHMTNCQPCELSWPAVRAVSETLRDLYPDLGFAYVESSQSTVTAHFNVSEFPSFRLHQGGSTSLCQVNTFAQHDDLYDCIDHLLTPTEVTRVERLQTVLDSVMISEFLMVGYFREKDHNLETFFRFAGRARNLNLLYTMDPATETRLGVGHANLLMFLPRSSLIPGMGTYYVFSGHFTEDNLMGFVREHLHVPLGQLTQRNHDLMFWKRPLCLFVFEVSWDREGIAFTKFIRGKIIELAQARPNVSFAFALPRVQEMRSLNFGISLDYSEFGVGCLDREGRKFVMPQEWDSSRFLEFVDMFFAGQIREYRRSRRGRGPKWVEQLTGENFDETVLGGSNWLLLFYESYSEQVKVAMRTFREFAKDYGMTDLRFGEMDLSRNDPHPMFYQHILVDPVLIYHSPVTTSVFSMEFDKQNIFNFVFPLEDPPFDHPLTEEL